MGLGQIVDGMGLGQEVGVGWTGMGLRQAGTSTGIWWTGTGWDWDGTGTE